jgi:pilus assembly protein CpaB
MGATRSIIIIAVAAFCALLAALLVGRLMSHPAKPAPVAAAPAKPMAQVLVAQHDLPVGTALTAGDLTWQAWPADSLNPSFITNGQPAQVAPASGAAAVASNVSRAAASVVTKSPMDALFGAIVREPILANEPVINSKLVRGGEGGFMAVVLHPGSRAIAVPITAASAAGGFILPGDRVDVLQSHQQEGGQNAGGSLFASKSGQVAQVLLRNVRVLAIDQATKAPKNAPSVIGAVATLEVPAADADVVVRAKAQGEIVLALRAYSDTSGPVGKTQPDIKAVGIVRVFHDGKPTEVMVSP